MVNVYVSRTRGTLKLQHKRHWIQDYGNQHSKNVGGNTMYGAFRADFDANSFLYECYAMQAGK